MRIIDRYIAKEFIIFFLVCALSLIVIATAFAALAEMPSLQKENGTEIFLQAILSGIPLLIEVVTPISVLLATVLTFISLSKTSEVIAMMTAGISTFRLVMPIMISVLGLVILLYLNQSYLAPSLGADERASLVKKKSNDDVWQFYNGDLFHFTIVDKREKSVREVSRYSFDTDNRIDRITIYEGADFSSIWTVEAVRKVNLGPGSIHQEIERGKTFEKGAFPVVFKEEIKVPKYSSFIQLFNEISIKSEGAVPFQRELFAVYQKVSGMLSVFVMVLLALPFSIYGGRSSNVRTGIVISVVLGFIFWLVDQLLVSFSDSVAIPLLISAFGANVLFIALAVSLILLKRS